MPVKTKYNRTVGVNTIHINALGNYCCLLKGFLIFFVDNLGLSKNMQNPAGGC